MTRGGVRKWWKEINAFQQGKEIEYRVIGEEGWFISDTPTFISNCEYRIKPEKKIDVATDKIIEDVFSSCFLTKQGKDVYIDKIKSTLKEVYGDD